MPAQNDRTSAMQEKPSHAFATLFAAHLLCGVAAIQFKVSSYEGVDPLGLLLGAEALLRSGFLSIDLFGAEVFGEYGYRITEIGGQTYHFFPYGSVLLAVPVVALANLMGFSVADPSVDFAIQRVMVFISFLLWSIALYRIADRFLPRWPALLTTGTFIWSTMLVSTGLTAFWSHNFGVVFAAFAIERAIVSIETRDPRAAALAGILVAFAYICRPTFLALAPFLVLFLAFNGWRLAAMALAGMAAMAVIFGAFNILQFGVVMPPYYGLGRVGGPVDPVALAGNLVSPARGLLVFMPVLVLCILSVFVRHGVVLPRAWLFLALAWPAAHLFGISRFDHWWGGGSYGPRFMTDALPGFFLLYLIGWSAFVRFETPVRAALFGSLVAVGIAIHAFHGLFSPWAVRWNTDPNVDQYPVYIFDWRYPQFVYNARSHARRQETHAEEYLAPLEAGASLRDAPELFNVGMPHICDGQDGAGEKTVCQEIEVWVVRHWVLDGTLALDLRCGASQRVSVTIDGALVHEGPCLPDIVIDFDTAYFGKMAGPGLVTALFASAGMSRQLPKIEAMEIK